MQADIDVKSGRFCWSDHLEFMRPINDLAFCCFGDKVMYGPFKGMQIPQYPMWEDGNIGTKLFGTYESELQPVIAAAIARQPKTIVNIGCAEGYYAIGLARLLPDAVVCAFDANEAAVAQCREYADKNGVGDRVRCRKGCLTAEELIIDGEEPFLYLVDCEGYELELVNLVKCPQLAKADLIVECHDFMNDKFSSTMVGRLMPTHTVQTIEPEDMPPYYPVIGGWPVYLRMLLVMDKRPVAIKWVAGWSKTHG